MSTDYPATQGAARQYQDSDYVAEIPGGGVARCNPVTAPGTCVDAEVEPRP